MPEEVAKKITRRVIKKGATRLNKAAEGPSRGVAENEQRGEVKTKRACHFHESKTFPSYTDINTLRRFLTDRQQIVPKAKSGLCSKHQRELTRQVKYARFLGLLPFAPRV